MFKFINHLKLDGIILSYLKECFFTSQILFYCFVELFYPIVLLVSIQAFVIPMYFRLLIHSMCMFLDFINNINNKTSKNTPCCGALQWFVSCFGLVWSLSKFFKSKVLIIQIIFATYNFFYVYWMFVFYFHNQFNFYFQMGCANK